MEHAMHQSVSLCSPGTGLPPSDEGERTYGHLRTSATKCWILRRVSITTPAWCVCLWDTPEDKGKTQIWTRPCWQLPFWNKRFDYPYYLSLLSKTPQAISGHKITQLFFKFICGIWLSDLLCQWISQVDYTYA